MSDVGITAILALLMDKVNVSGHNTSTGMVQGIESLDLSRSPIFQSRHRFAFLQALVVSTVAINARHHIAGVGRCM